jgi:hypothetical protein
MVGVMTMICHFVFQTPLDKLSKKFKLPCPALSRKLSGALHHNERDYLRAEYTEVS